MLLFQIDELSQKLPQKIDDDKFYETMKDLEKKNNDATKRLEDAVSRAEALLSTVTAYKNGASEQMLKISEVPSQKQ